MQRVALLGVLRHERRGLAHLAEVVYARHAHGGDPRMAEHIRNWEERMGFQYLGGKTWLEVTREERLFCSFLYWDISGNGRAFVEWLNQNSQLRLEPDADWEAGYEVCFYRDFFRFKGVSARGRGFSPKRTFDLCLFSEDCIIIFEAKVHQGFVAWQLRRRWRAHEYIDWCVRKAKNKQVIQNGNPWAQYNWPERGSSKQEIRIGH
jgi:hypothetical protein